MELPKQQNLDTLHLQRLFDNMSESYKLFWFQAIVENVAAGHDNLTYDELINNMIADAWYMVSEYKLNLGPADTLEALARYAYTVSGLKSSEKRETIISTLGSLDDKELIKKKQVLTYNVPYRLQAPFLTNLKGKLWDGPKSELAERINGESNIIYRFSNIVGMDSRIIVDPDWANYIKSNYEIIRGWIQYNMIIYLQRRNPSVPGISNKLYAPQKRKLELVKKYWKAVIAVSSVYDIYGDLAMDNSDVSIDHFIPWSYVAHDELWNLIPTTRSVNSQKSNHLPDWDTYFERLCIVEYQAYQMVWAYEEVQTEFDKCIKEHVNNIDVQHKLYRPNISRSEFYANLEELIKPVYISAHNLGFDIWRL